MSGLAEAGADARPFARARAVWERAVFDLRLLLGRRLGVLVAVNAAILLYGLFDALVRSTGLDDAYRHHVSMVLVPLFVLALPVLSSVVAVERRSGSIDLALSARSTERYFGGRALAVCVPFALQGAVLSLLAPHPRLGPKLGGAVFAVVVAGLLGAVVLFWAVRLRSSGAVAVASAATLAALGRWVFHDPYPARVQRWGPPSALPWLPTHLLGSLWSLLVLVLAAVLFYLYARQRLRRPETLL